MVRKTAEQSLQVYWQHYLENKSINAHNKELVQHFFRDADLDKFDRAIKTKRRLKYIEIFRKLETWFNHKDFEKITAADFETWYLDLKTDKLKRDDGKPYKPNSKATYRVAVKTFWKWLKGEGETFPAEVRSFKNGWEMKKPEALRKAEVEALAASFRELKYRFATLLLFDTGFRIDEFLSMRKKNLTLMSKDDGTEYYLAECERSKTKPRKVAVDLYTQTYNDYMREYHATTKQDEPLFSTTYEGYRKALAYQSKKLLNTNVTPHRLRKSSATYFAGILKDPYRLNKRMGWTINSDVSQVYIDESGIGEEQTIDLVTNNKALELERENKQLKHRLELIEQQVKLIIAGRLKKLNS